MNLNEIKAAVESGKTVHWANAGYRVVKGASGFLIVYESGDAIGLTWADGETLNGEPGEFFTA